MFTVDHKNFLNNKRKLYHTYIDDHRQKMNQILSCIYHLNKKSFIYIQLKTKTISLFSQHPEFTLHFRALDFLSSNTNIITYPFNSEKIPKWSCLWNVSPFSGKHSLSLAISVKATVWHEVFINRVLWTYSNRCA